MSSLKLGSCCCEVGCVFFGCVGCAVGCVPYIYLFVETISKLYITDGHRLFSETFVCHINLILHVMSDKATFVSVALFCVQRYC